MNVADSQLLASVNLEKMGHRAADDPEEADIYVINTCVGASERRRQSLMVVWDNSNSTKKKTRTKLSG